MPFCDASTSCLPLTQHGTLSPAVDRITDITYFALKGIMMVKARDLVTIGRIVVPRRCDCYRHRRFPSMLTPLIVRPGRSEYLPDGSLIVYAISVEHSKMPPHPDFVRAELLYSVNVFKRMPSDPNSTHVIYSVGSDPKGTAKQCLTSACLLCAPVDVGISRV